jgi:hypothetical protein
MVLKIRTWRLAVPILALSLLAHGSVLAEPAQFDLAGPKLDVTVTHAGVTLPISEVPNLSVGDQLWIRADLPVGQSVHYLLVAAFLRGATNPPPQSWFYRSQTWTPKGADGLKITVPQDAQQVLVFLAPQTGGDFKTLMDAVRGRPGAFVRASQDLNQATLDRSRIDAYVAGISKASQADPDYLRTVSPLLARSLTIKLNADCLQKAPEVQAACLMSGQDSLVLNDGHSTSLVQGLTTGSTGDLVAQLSVSPVAGFGYYSPYVASVVDIARILDSFRTAQYQYIPALATDHDAQLSLLLNAPPSFHNPMSVMVVALPAVQPPQPPPLHPVDPRDVYCAQKSQLVLPVDGAPLVFSTAYAHDMVLRLKNKAGVVVDLPLKADAEKGGFVADTSGLDPASFGDAVVGSLHGQWGFEPYNGPEFHLQTAHPEHWQLVTDDQQSLIVGRDGTVRLEAQGAACVESVMLQQPSGETEKADWKPAEHNQVAVTVPLKTARPGAMTLLVKQYGSKTTEAVPLQAFDQPGHLETFSFHAGDSFGVLKGSRLDQVAALTIDGVEFKPGATSSKSDDNGLTLVTSDTVGAARLKAGESATAKVALKDGRNVRLKIAFEAPRPTLTLIGKTVQPFAPDGAPIILGNPDDLPFGAALTFSVRAKLPDSFTGAETIEVATIDGGFSTTLTPTNGLTLADPHVLLATLDTGRAFSASAAGALQFRLRSSQGPSDWSSLATLVRLPVLHDLKCPAEADQLCKLTGSNLFLIDALSNTPDFAHSVPVAEGYTGYVLLVPHPRAGKLYIRLHDDPSAANAVTFPIGR